MREEKMDYDVETHVNLDSNDKIDQTESSNLSKGSKSKYITGKRGPGIGNASKFVDCWTVTGKFVARFESGSVASIALGIPVGEISSSCRGSKDVVRELFRFRYADEGIPDLVNFQDETRSSSRAAAARGGIRHEPDEDDEPPTKKSKSKQPHTTPSGSYGAKQSTYFVDAKEEAELRRRLRNVRPRRWMKQLCEPGDWGLPRDASAPFTLSRWTPTRLKSSELAPLLMKLDDPFVQGFAGLQKKSWRESRGLAPKDSVTLQIVPQSTPIIGALEAATFDASALM